MGKVKAYFMERIETDPEFRREAELAELGRIEPEFPEGEEERDLTCQEAESDLVQPF